MSRRRYGGGISGTDAWRLEVKPLPDRGWRWVVYPPARLPWPAVAARGEALTHRGAYRLARRVIRRQERAVARRGRREALAVREQITP